MSALYALQSLFSPMSMSIVFLSSSPFFAHYSHLPNSVTPSFCAWPLAPNQYLTKETGNTMAYTVRFSSIFLSVQPFPLCFTSCIDNVKMNVCRISMSKWALVLRVLVRVKTVPCKPSFILTPPQRCAPSHSRFLTSGFLSSCFLAGSVATNHTYFCTIHTKIEFLSTSVTNCQESDQPTHIDPSTLPWVSQIW